MQKQILEDLRTAMMPYQFYWDEWTINGNCNLDAEDVSIVNSHISNNFTLTTLDFLDHLFHYEKIGQIREIIKKLERADQLFKQFVVVDFLMALLEQASNYQDGYDLFLITPIHQLNMPLEIKNELIKFETICIGYLIRTTKPEDFSRGMLYRRIVEFQTARKFLKNRVENRNQSQENGLQATIK